MSFRLVIQLVTRDDYIIYDIQYIFTVPTFFYLCFDSEVWDSLETHMGFGKVFFPCHFPSSTYALGGDSARFYFITSYEIYISNRVGCGKHKGIKLSTIDPTFKQSTLYSHFRKCRLNWSLNRQKLAPQPVFRCQAAAPPMDVKRSMDGQWRVHRGAHLLDFSYWLPDDAIPCYFPYETHRNGSQ